MFGVIERLGGPVGGALGAVGATGSAGVSGRPKLADVIGAAETGRAKLFWVRRKGGS